MELCGGDAYTWDCVSIFGETVGPVIVQLSGSLLCAARHQHAFVCRGRYELMGRMLSTPSRFAISAVQLRDDVRVPVARARAYAAAEERGELALDLQSRACTRVFSEG
jgi:hypothetical protein